MGLYQISGECKTSEGQIELSGQAGDKTEHRAGNVWFHIKYGELSNLGEGGRPNLAEERV